MNKLYILIVLLVLFGTLAFKSFLSPVSISGLVVSAEAQNAPISDSRGKSGQDTGVPQKDGLDKQLDQLAYCESGGRDRIKHLDSNGEYSYSRYQFQFPTFKANIRKYGLLPNSEDEELWNWIYDGDFQRELVRKMIEDDRANFAHWRNCATKLRLL